MLPARQVLFACKPYKFFRITLIVMSDIGKNFNCISVDNISLKKNGADNIVMLRKFLGAV
jgi:hypothetical protein